MHELDTLTKLIKDNEVNFDFYRGGIMYYRITSPVSSTTYRFPVHLDDIGSAELLSKDKAIMFMRYIRKAEESQSLETLSNNG